MIESTIHLGGVGQTFFRFSGWFKGHVCGQENGVGDGLGMRLETEYIWATHAVAKMTTLWCELEYND